MNSDAALSITYHRQGLAKRFLIVAVLAVILLYSTFAFSQIIGTGQLNIERRGHSATLLEDGKVLIVGGDNQNGAVSQAEVFDPASQTSALAATSITPRTDHSATRLSNGRVLVIGGRDQSASLQSTEIYDPVTLSFVVGPSMMRARSGHTATILSDGKILVAGGDLFASAEIYDPVTESFSLVSESLNTARKFHSAILTSSGQVMIVGGVNAQGAMLNTAEVFDPASQSFYMPPTDMQTARAFATLKLLPDGKVQIIGGDAELSMEVFDPADGIFIAKALLPPNVGLLDATLSTQSRAALFSPSISQDPLLQGVLTSEQLALLDRADQSITELPSRNQALVAGGINSTGQILNSAKLVSSSSASVTTDKTDYAPGQIVTITGSGFQPNEQVDIYFHEFPEEYPDIFFSTVTNQQGNFVVAEFAPQEIDLGRIFTLTAIGQTSGFTAQTAFKDFRPNTVDVGTQTPNPVLAGASAEYVVSVTFNGNATACAVNLSVSGLPVGASLGGFNPASVTNTNGSSTLTLNTTFSLTANAYPFTVTATPVTDSCQGGSSPQSGNGTLVVAAAAPTTLQASAASGTYGGTVNLSAALTKISDSSAVSGKTITFSLNGTSVGSATTNASGIATLNNVSLSGISAGIYPTGIGASFAGDVGFATSSGTNSLTLEKANQTISVTTPAPSSAVFNTTFNVAATGGASGNAVVITASGVCSGSGDNAASILMASGTGTCTVKYNQAGNDNYNPAPEVSSDTTAQKANQTISVTTPAPSSAVFNTTFNVAATGGASGNAVVITASGVCSGSGDNAASILMASGTGTCTVKYNQAGNDNYNPAPEVSSDTTAQKAAATVNLSGLGTYIFDGTAKEIVATTNPAGLTVEVTYNGSATPPISVGNYTMVGTIDDQNYQGSANGTLVISAWTLAGFYQPVDMSPLAPATIVWNSVKSGSTVPLKFKAFAGTVELKDVSVIKSLSAISGACSGGMEVPLDELSATGGTSLRYDTTGGQFIFNWQTPKKAGICYMVTMTTQDGSGLSAYFKAK